MRVNEIVYHAMIEQEMAEAAGTDVRAAWDPVAQVWFTTWSAVPGVNTEAPTLEELQAKIQVIVADLQEAANE